MKHKNQSVVATKDVDQMSDTGGKSMHNDLTRPPRDDRRNRYNEDEISKEDKDDYKDTVFDKDLNGEIKMNNRFIAKELFKIAKEICADIGTLWSDNDEHVQMVKDGKLDSAVQSWLKYLNGLINTEYTSTKVDISLSYGKSYIKVIKKDSQTSVYCFINKQNGDLLKAATWNAPAKHARGNVFDRASWKYTGSYGLSYLR